MIANIYRSSSASRLIESLDESAISIGECIGKDENFKLAIIQFMNCVAEDPNQLRNRQSEVTAKILKEIPTFLHGKAREIAWCAVVTASEGFFERLESTLETPSNINALRDGWFRMLGFSLMQESLVSVSEVTVQEWRQEFFCTIESFARKINS